MGVDVSATIQAKSDQLNADDLIGRDPITITITAVKKGDAEQPIAIHYEGDNGRPYKPGKSMRRVLVALWGPDGDEYVGRSMTLYRDPEVEFGKLKVGGVRISEMSHLERSEAIPLTVRRGSKSMFNVRPLKTAEPAKPSKPKRTPEEQVVAYKAGLAAAETLEALANYQAGDQVRKWTDNLKTARPDLFEQVVAANSARAAALSPPALTTTDDGDGLAIDGPDDDGDDFEFPADPAVDNPGTGE